jgi:hypothetical protein
LDVFERIFLINFSRCVNCLVCFIKTGMKQTISLAILMGMTAGVSLMGPREARGSVILNSGFEDFSQIPLADGELTSTANPGASPLVYVTVNPAPSWTVDTQAGGTMNPTNAYMPGEALGGQYVGWSSGALIYQVLSDDIQPSTQYTFTVNVGRPTVSSGAFAYRIIMESAGLVDVQDKNTQPIAVGTWGTATVTWESPAVVEPGHKLTINMAADEGVALFDDVAVSAGPVPFPEPTAALAMIVPGVMGMMRRRRKV